MKTKIAFVSSLLIFALAGAAGRADEIVKPTPAPVVKDDLDQNLSDEPAVIDHVVYLAKLPSPDALIKAADQKGTPVLRMDQTSDRILVVYQYAGGRTVTFAYTLLSTAGSPHASTVMPPSSAAYSVVEPSPAPGTTTVVYQEQPPVVYYTPSVRYYDPAWDFWTPLAVGIGLGWGFGGHSYHGGYHGGFGGGYHGGYHGGGRH